jgi:hypothetical protein
VSGKLLHTGASFSIAATGLSGTGRLNGLRPWRPRYSSLLNKNITK